MYLVKAILFFPNRYITDMLNMLQPVYVFIIFVLKRNVINVILGRDRKKRISSRPPRTKESRLSHKTSTRSRQRKSSVPTRHSNPVFSISLNKDTDLSSVVLLSDRPCEDVPLKLPNGNNNEEEVTNGDTP